MNYTKQKMKLVKKHTSLKIFYIINSLTHRYNKYKNKNNINFNKNNKGIILNFLEVCPIWIPTKKYHNQIMVQVLQLSAKQILMRKISSNYKINSKMIQFHKNNKIKK